MGPSSCWRGASCGRGAAGNVLRGSVPGIGLQAGPPVKFRPETRLLCPDFSLIPEECKLVLRFPSHWKWPRRVRGHERKGRHQWPGLES